MAKLWSDSLNLLCLVGYFLLKTPILGGETTHVQLYRGHQGGGGQGEAGADQRLQDARQQDAHLYQAMMLSLKHFKHCIYN